MASSRGALGPISESGADHGLAGDAPPALDGAGRADDERAVLLGPPAPRAGRDRRGPDRRHPAAERARQEPLEPRLAAADLEDSQLGPKREPDRLAADGELGRHRAVVRGHRPPVAIDDLRAGRGQAIEPGAARRSDEEGGFHCPGP
jgi:hypothetical protein